MLVLSRVSHDVLRQQAFETSAKQIASMLRMVWPEADVRRGAPSFEQRVHAALVAAHGYGLTTRYQAASYANIAIALGDDFDQRLGWAKAILADDTITPDDRVTLLHRYAAEELERQP